MKVVENFIWNGLILEKEYFIIFVYKIFDHPLKCNNFLEIGSNVFDFFF